MALRLKGRGVTRVRPLDGGIARWIALNLPVIDLAAPATPGLETAVTVAAPRCQSTRNGRRGTQ